MGPKLWKVALSTRLGFGHNSVFSARSVCEDGDVQGPEGSRDPQIAFLAKVGGEKTSDSEASATFQLIELSGHVVGGSGLISHRMLLLGTCLLCICRS